jgi:dipeptidyl aminopeptidase/acylaminoacyl peptidase
MPQPLTPETLVYKLTPAGDPRVAPDGRRIVFSRATADREAKKVGGQLWLCDIDGGAARQLTWSGERNGGAVWSPDGAAIAFISDRVEKSGLFVLPADGGEPRELTRHRQPITSPAWSPDGRWIAYTTRYDPENPEEKEPPPRAAPRVRVTRRIDYKQDGQGYLGDARGHIFVVPAEGGERRRVTVEAVDYHFPLWSPDGRRLAARRPNRNEMCSQLALIEVDTGATTLVGPELGVVSTWAWSPDGDRIIFSGDTAQTWQTDFFLYTVATGELRRLTDDLPCLPDPGFPGLAPPSTPVWLDERRVLFHAVRAGASGLYIIDVETAQVETVHTWPALHVGLSVDAERRYVVQGHASLEAVGEISRFDCQTGAARLITSTSRPTLAEAPAARWERFDLRRGGFTIEAWLLAPPDFDPTRRYPVVMDIHGGPNGWYGYGFNPVQQCLATHGFLVVFSNPRGSGSYGRQFTQQVTRDWGGEDYLDLLAVLDAVLERSYADRERTGIYGYSYGGYMTAWMIGQTDRFRAAVCGAPCFDLESMYGTSDISHTFGDLQWGGAPHEASAWYAARSPSSFAHRARTPTLIVHGEADERCPIGQGEQMFVALHKAGCEVEFVRYPGGYHGFLRTGPPEHRADYLARVLAWFQRHLGAPA